MIASLLTILGALVTIVGPILTAAAAAYVDKQQEKESHATLDEVDQYIDQHLKGDPAGLLNLTVKLARLRDEATRKRHHTGQ